MMVLCEATTTKWLRTGSEYTCKVSQKQLSEFEDIFQIIQHANGKNGADVTAIWFWNCRIPRIPQRLLDYFPNLRAICIEGCNMKSISKDDLVKYSNFRSISFYGNRIEYLPGNLFENFKNLETLSFSTNNLKFIEPNILDGLDKLSYLDLRSNPNFDIVHSDDPEHPPSATIQEIKNELQKKFYSRFKIAQELKNSNETLGLVIQNLNEKLKSLRTQNSKNPNQEKQETRDISNSNKKLKIDLENSQKDCQSLRSLNVKLSQEVLNLKLAGEKWKKKHKTSQQQSKVVDLNSSTNLLSDLKNLTQDETFKDFKIIIDDREFPVHKFLLAARSPTLAEMLRNNPEAENLKLVDISVEIFELILKFLYTDELPSEDGTNYMHLFAAAGRMKIKELENFAAVKLLDGVNGENAMEILKLSNKYGHDKLKQKAFDEVKKNYPKIEFKDEWIEDGEKMAKIIEAFKIREEMMRKVEEEFKKNVGII